MTIPPVSLFFKNTSAFSLVELLVAISILATISVVAYVSYAGHMKLANNATRIHTIDALHLSLSDYAQMKKTLPEPNSNSISYDERGTYMHSLSGAYGVSGYVSDTFLPKGYVNFPATDPESSQFYGYGKLTDNSAFDVAAVLYDEVTGGYKTYLRGTYSRQRLTSLIRAYSSSNFVSQDSTENLPYNPYERKITGHILNFSGSVEVTNSAKESVSLTGELNSGDTIVVGTGGSALLHISDGSELSLGSATTETVLKLTTLTYSDDHNLASKVKLLLSLGEVWTETPHLRSEPDSESDLSIETDSAVAAVRGTVFGVSRGSTGATTLSLASGKLEVEKIDTTGVTTPFTTNFSTTATGGFIIAPDAKSYMVVPEGAMPITLEGIANTNNAGGASILSTGTLTPSVVEKKLQRPPFSLGYRPKAEKISFSTGADVGGTTQTGTLSVTFNNPGADSYELSFGTGEVTDETFFQSPNPINPTLTGTLSTTGTLMTVTGAFAYISEPHLTRTYTFRVCFQGKCSAPDIKHLGGETFDFAGFRVWEEKCPSGTVLWGTLVGTPEKKCQDKNLVAFAPYNKPGDLKLYGAKGTYTEGYSTGLLDQEFDYSAPTFPKYIKFGGGDPWVPKTFTGEFEEGYDDGEKAELWISEYLSGSSFFRFLHGGGGIFLDNYNTETSGDKKKDSLRYNLSWLDLGSNFSIEMRVRGGALKRSGWPFFLADTNTTNKYLLWVSGWKLYFGTSMSNAVSKQISELGTQIQDNDFYRIIAKTTTTGNELVIKNAAWTPIFSGNWTSMPVFNNGQLFVWSSYWLSYQWNDIIDSVKIYKN